MKNKWKKGILFSFLSLSILSSPLQVFAAGKPLTKSVTIVADSKEYKKEAEKSFQKKITENGKSYELVDIAYNIVDQEYTETLTKTVEMQSEPHLTMEEGGITYALVSKNTKETVRQPAATQTVTGWDEYDHAVTAANVPATKVVHAKNDVTGEMEDVTCSLTGITQTGTKTVTNTMSLTFSDYDASYYEWNGHLTPRNDSTPALSGYEAELLSSVGATSGSRITSINWVGSPYTGSDGVVYRDATANVEQQIQVYRANYSGAITTPEEKEVIYTATYSAPDQDGAVEYKVVATATYNPVTSIIPMVVTGVGILIFILLVVAVLYILRKRKKEKPANT